MTVVIASSFENKNSGGSPNIDDCRQIATNIAGDGTFTVPCAERREHTFAKFGTCAIGAHCNIGGPNIAHVGNEDAIDWINVGSHCAMECSDSLNEQTGVIWGVYHT